MRPRTFDNYFPKKDLNKPRLVLTLSKLEHALHLSTCAKCLELI